jgi:hypothetical protein
VFGRDFPDLGSSRGSGRNESHRDSQGWRPERSATESHSNGTRDRRAARRVARGFHPYRIASQAGQPAKSPLTGLFSFSFCIFELRVNANRAA